MAFTYFDDRPREVAIQVFDHPEAHRTKAGDIIAARLLTHGNHHGEIGRSDVERNHLVWLRVQSTQQDLGNLLLDGPWEDLADPDAPQLHEKRRYCIPLARLQQFAPWLDLARCRDRSDPYQPFMGGIDRDKAPSWTLAEALSRFPEQRDELTALMNQVRRKRKGRINPLDDAKILNRLVYLSDVDLTFKLDVSREQTGGHFYAPRRPLPAEGLIFDKRTGRYL